MKISVGSSLALVAALFLTACELPKREQPPQGPAGEPTAHWSDATRQQMLVAVNQEGGGEPETLNVNDVLADEDTLFRALRTQFPSFDGPDDLGGYIRNIEARLKEGSPDVPEFRGYGGVLNRAFFNAARKTLDGDFRFDREKRVLLMLYGQIIEYEFNRNANDPSIGTGRLKSITYFTTVELPVTPPGYRGRIISMTDAVRWEVEVRDDGFSVREREYADPTDPFPDTLDFSPEMVNRVNSLGFQYKLWAEGDSINIIEVARKDDGETDFTRLDLSEPEYKVGPESCIDMMFVDPPPQMLNGIGPPLYCLGRCDHPHLINTGADG